ARRMLGTPRAIISEPCTPSTRYGARDALGIGMQVKEQLDRAVSDFIWNIVEVNSQLEEIHKTWAQLLGITEPQWLILMAVDELDEGRGVSGIAVANKLRIHPAFVTNQTKKLEAMELLSRVTSPDDARYLRISLTQKAQAEIRKLSIKRQSLNATMLDGLDEESLHYVNKRLILIAKNSRLASQKLSIGIL
ncbi:MarR family winged helix-turn-helix transcriptional regulator, partial [Bradyrhizobium iriomotense]|uniref:MarR family winged helix-turn-helix transcriptional regulator n=1 Tax=Bradyrhizobium iriomotense TaxID=441950 RepID=UPI0024E049D8